MSDLFKRAIAAGYGEEDVMALIKVLRALKQRCEGREVTATFLPPRPLPRYYTAPLHHSTPTTLSSMTARLP